MSLERPNTLGERIRAASLAEMERRSRYQQLYGKPTGPTVPSARALACQSIESLLDYENLRTALES